MPKQGRHHAALVAGLVGYRPPDDGKLKDKHDMIRNMNEAKPGSAWHAWQMYGKAWRAENPRGDIERGAEWFATLPGYPPQAYSARKRAFIEGASK